MWFEHPRYKPVRDKLIEALSSPPYRFRKLSPVVFLCGAAESKPRDTLKKYIFSKRPELRVFYAELVWEAIAKRGNISALEMENQLAALADIVIVIVESAGTFTELGAFSVSECLRKKLLPIVNILYKSHKNSFISTGPIRWVDDTSDFAPTIYAPLNMILTAADELEERLDRIKKRETTLKDLRGNHMHILFFLCDLVAMIYPASLESISLYMAKIAPALRMEDPNIHLLLSLGKAMDLLKLTRIDDTDFYSPASLDIISSPYHHVPLVNFGSFRGEHAAVLQTIPEAREILRKIGGLD